jgi:hypothetical protein
LAYILLTVKYQNEGDKVFLKRTNKVAGKQPCARCSILRLYFSAILLIVVASILVGDKVSYLSFVNKQTGVYVVFSFGAIVSLYRILEWYFFLREPKQSD